MLTVFSVNVFQASTAQGSGRGAKGEGQKKERPKGHSSHVNEKHSRFPANQNARAIYSTISIILKGTLIMDS